MLDRMRERKQYIQSGNEAADAQDLPTNLAAQAAKVVTRAMWLDNEQQIACR